VYARYGRIFSLRCDNTALLGATTRVLDQDLKSYLIGVLRTLLFLDRLSLEQEEMTLYVSKN